jgi:uncharacterized protein YbcI
MRAGEAGHVQSGPPSVHSADLSLAACEAGTKLSRGLIEFYKDLYGRGPTRVRTVVSAELAVTAMHEILTVGERTLVAGGKVAEIERTRLRAAEITRPQLIALAAEVLGVEVTASVTGISVEDDLATETFLLAPRGEAVLNSAPGG